jgi:hypothetical protein
MDLSRDTGLGSAESKDLGGAYSSHAARNFSTTEALEQDLLLASSWASAPEKDRGGSARCGHRRLKSSERHR